MAIKLKTGRLYAAQDGTALFCDDSAGYSAWMTVKRLGREIALMGARERYSIHVGMVFSYRSGGLFGGQEDNPDFPWHIVREIEP